MNEDSGLLKAVAIAAAFVLFGCGGGGGGGDSQPSNNAPGNNNPSTARHTVGGVMTGLRTNDAVNMRMTAGGVVKGDVRVTTNGPYTFPETVAANEAYVVTIESKPPDLPCTLSNATGVATANVSNVSVLCLSVSGRVDGLNGVLQLQLSVDGGTPLRRRVDDDETVASPNCFSCGTLYFFPFAVAPGQSYVVSVALQPEGQNCTVAHGSGTMGSTHVSNVGVTCTTTGTIPPYFTVGGSVVGTPIGRTGLEMTVDGDASAGPFVAHTTPFTLPHRVRPGQSYSVRLPFPGATGNCILQNGNGVMGSANVTNVLVDCTTIPTYTVSGSISGLIASGGTNALILRLSGNLGQVEDEFLISDGAFTFDFTRLLSGQSYSISVVRQPSGQTCTVSNPTGLIGSSNVANISVTCTTTLTCPSIDGTTVTGASFSGNVSVSGVTTTPVLNYGVTYSSSQFAVSGSLKLRLWAIRSSYTGGEPTFDRPEGPQLISTFEPVFTGRAGAASANQLFNGATISNLTTIGSTGGLSGGRPPRGVYCLMVTLDQFDPSCTTWVDGYCMADFHQFASPPVIFQ